MSAYLPTLAGFAKFSAYSTGALLFLTAGGLFFGQTYLIYPAYVPPGSREIVSTPADYGVPYEDVDLVTEDGVRIKAFLMMQGRRRPDEEKEDGDDDKSDEIAENSPTVLFFHANAGNVGHRIPLARMFYEHRHCNVFMLSYRGYGHSDGSPSEKGIQRDSQAALDYILKHPILKSTTLIFYGQSLGGAVAIDLAARNPGRVNALILENTFTSMPEMAKKVMPIVKPFIFLCTERWNSLRAIKNVLPSTSILFLSGGEDELVPPSHMKELWKAVTEKGTERRVWREYKKGTHNSTCVQPGYWKDVGAFIDGL